MGHPVPTLMLIPIRCPELPHLIIPPRFFGNRLFMAKNVAIYSRNKIDIHIPEMR